MYFSTYIFKSYRLFSLYFALYIINIFIYTSLYISISYFAYFRRDEWVSEEYNSLTFSRKIKELFEKSVEEFWEKKSMPLHNQEPRGSKSLTGGSNFASTEVEQLSHLMALVAPQGDMMAECMGAVRQVKDNVTALSHRVTKIDRQWYLLLTKGINASVQQDASDAPDRAGTWSWKSVDLVRWH